jgi:uncharacterized protein (TIGR01777 family)
MGTPSNMNILMTGATGFIGRALIPRLQQQGHRIHAWVRDQQRARIGLDPQVLASESLTQHLSNPIDAVINLAGEPIADKRWTAERKQALRMSRIDLTQQLIEALARNNQRPGLFISGSAIGFYGSQPDDKILDEDADAAPGFTHSLCADWEQAAMAFSADDNRVCLLRTGVVLGKNGGALAKMLPPFKLGLGGPIGDGRQTMSWIHIDDWINACVYLIENHDMQGAYNFTAPQPVSNKAFTRALSRAVRRPALFRVPCKVLQIAMGEGSELLCEGQKVVPKRLLDHGFRFEHPDIDEAMNSIVR